MFTYLLFAYIYSWIFLLSPDCHLHTMYLFFAYISREISCKGDAKQMAAARAYIPKPLALPPVPLQCANHASEKFREPWRGVEIMGLLIWA